MKADALPASAEAAQDPLWFKDAVIYELHVKAYADANGDGIGDFAGLTQHLDHVQSLGVNTIWLLPFYPSPLRDDGYDVSDYENVHPSYGSLDDVRRFVDEAHRRGLRVITELVVNHTSDQHPWFQRARRAPRGSPEREFYVWSDDPKRYAGTRIIFTDTEKSNWAWDEVAQQYYWHRFFSHQPDLNFDNPAVLEAVVRIMESWLEMGIDGFRLDAIPYLIERDGTSNENLRETHEVIKEIRRRVDAKYPGRLLLAEANMWPEDVREYFGDGDECHMAYHFPLMPRMYMAIAQEERHPIYEILAQTPEIPPNCQWAIFLRNHDELTLEMVTSRERDYMWRMYAADPRARINLGIRRRLAPLLENDRPRIELMNSLLLSMPGTPVLYYGDEIGMGDNIFLGDRDGVRTPMQWTSDRNGGFSRADPQRLYLPPIQDPVYGYEAVNVEAQSREPSSLLNWTRRMLAVRASSQAFGRGRFTMLHPGNRKIVAYLRELDDEVILCVANMSRAAQPVELDLHAYRGRVPVEMLGRHAFPPIGDLPYLLTLPGHGFFWFRLAADAAPPDWHVDRAPAEDLPVLVLFDGWNSLFRQRVVPWRIGLADKLRAQLEDELLPRYLRRQRWFDGHGDIARVRVVDHALLEGGAGQWLLALMDGEAGPTAPPRWFLPLAIAFEDHDEERLRALAPVAVSRVRQQAAVGVLADAMGDEAFCRALVDAVGGARSLAAEHGSVRFTPGASFAALVGQAPPQAWSLLRLGTGTNSITLLGERLMLKAYRRLQPGVCPELEMARHLGDAVGFPHVVPLAGSVEYQRDGGEPVVLALLQAQVAHQGDAWGFVVEQLTRLLEAHLAGTLTVDEALAPIAERITVLARRVAELHAALARPTGDPAFEPEPVDAVDLEQWLQAAREQLQRTLVGAEARGIALDPGVAASLSEAIERARGTPLAALRRTRVHGSLHLSEVLVVQDDFVLIDFEGDASVPVAERRAKHSALRDVAALRCAFDEAQHAALASMAQLAGERERLTAAARQWAAAVRSAFWRAYADAAVGAGLYPDAAALDALRALLAVFEIERALRMLRHALEHRPDAIAQRLAALADAAATRGD
ncbi:maltose alpha-D-glucosyltransferase [Azohydromonas sp.]|uniref:maltose alpha-D-glucosyltransferase n=1 Tax=Azohydromonas sp. TaxID=1872666 RepID=UPI002B8C0F72|nr:maltose alpha-D-glucosyltransferase [Azohydromonas sp.]HMM85157.1 maltose alpha-D-glucosyltransferase [Azohydromonas sp.]